jgi:hypothetical protein
MMDKLHNQFDFSGKDCFINFSIEENPFDEYSFAPFRAEP